MARSAYCQICFVLVSNQSSVCRIQNESSTIPHILARHVVSIQHRFVACRLHEPLHHQLALATVELQREQPQRTYQRIIGSELVCVVIRESKQTGTRHADAHQQENHRLFNNMLITLRFAFRFRKQCEQLFTRKIHSRTDLISSLDAIEDNIVDPADLKQFQNRVVEKKKKLAVFFDHNSIVNSMRPTIVNRITFQISNEILQTKLKSIGQKGQILQILSDQCFALDKEYEAYRQTMSNYLLNKKLLNMIFRRFGLIQQKLCENFFEGYLTLKEKQGTHNIFESLLNEPKDKTKFKEDFQFKLLPVSESQIAMLADIIYVVCKFNIKATKLYLLAELILKDQLDKINGSVAAKYFYILARCNRAIRSIEDRLSQVIDQNSAQSTSNLNILFYLCVNKLFSYDNMRKVVTSINQHGSDGLGKQQKKLLYQLKKYLQVNEEISDLKINTLNEARINQIQTLLRQQHKSKSPEENHFQEYLKKLNYTYQMGEEPYMLKRAYLFGKTQTRIVYFDANYYTSKTSCIGELALMKTYLKKTNIPFKSINIHNVLNLETRRQVYQYYESKLEKDWRVEIDKPLYYSF